MSFECPFGYPFHVDYVKLIYKKKDFLKAIWPFMLFAIITFLLLSFVLLLLLFLVVAVVVEVVVVAVVVEVYIYIYRHRYR